MSFFQILGLALSDLAPQETLACHGQWSTSSRHVYASTAQLGSGEGPFVEVVDARWSGTLSAPFEFSVIAFLATSGQIFWAKSSTVSTVLPLQVSVTAGEPAHQTATFTGSAGSASLPAIPIASPRTLEAVCGAQPRLLTTANVARIAETTEGAFFIAALPRPLLKVGRNHLWRIRDELAPRLPPVIRDVLTRRRAGTILTETCVHPS